MRVDGGMAPNWIRPGHDASGFPREAGNVASDLQETLARSSTLMAVWRYAALGCITHGESVSTLLSFERSLEASHVLH
jgi:hypothetical protein